MSAGVTRAPPQWERSLTKRHSIGALDGGVAGQIEGSAKELVEAPGEISGGAGQGTACLPCEQRMALRTEHHRVSVHRLQEMLQRLAKLEAWGSDSIETYSALILQALECGRWTAVLSEKLSTSS